MGSAQKEALRADASEEAYLSERHLDLEHLPQLAVRELLVIGPKALRVGLLLEALE